MPNVSKFISKEFFIGSFQDKFWLKPAEKTNPIKSYL